MSGSHESLESVEDLNIPALGLTMRVRPVSLNGTSPLTILETTQAPGFGPPLHLHPQAEIFRVLEGEYLYQVGEERFKAHPGDLITVPGGEPHAFLNLTAHPARQLVITLPAMDAYGYFVGLGELMSGARTTLAQLNEFGARWGIETLGPPLRPDPTSDPPVLNPS